MNYDSISQSIMLPHSVLVTDWLNGIVYMTFVWQFVNVIQDKIGLCKQGLHRASISPAKHCWFKGPSLTLLLLQMVYSREMETCHSWWCPGSLFCKIISNRSKQNYPFANVNTDFWSLVTRYANDFQSWLHHSWKSLSNGLTRDEEIVIHLNVYIILYMYWNH